MQACTPEVFHSTKQCSFPPSDFPVAELQAHIEPSHSSCQPQDCPRCRALPHSSFSPTTSILCKPAPAAVRNQHHGPTHDAALDRILYEPSKYLEDGFTVPHCGGQLCHRGLPVPWLAASVRGSRSGTTIYDDLSSEGRAVQHPGHDTGASDPAHSGKIYLNY